MLVSWCLGICWGSSLQSEKARTGVWGLDEVLAGFALVLWIIVDRISDSLYGGSDPDTLKIWIVRGVLLVVMIGAYAICRKIWHIDKEDV